MIPYGRQDINQEDIDAVIKVLQSDFLTQGPVVPAFENAVASYCGTRYSVAVNSATSALHLACLALGVNKGDIVWTTPITFVASANCALYCGAQIDFVDIDPHSYNLSVDRLAEMLAQAKKNGNLPKVVIPVHFSGQSCDMEGIHALSQQYGFKIIEDASHAIGGRYKDGPIGSCYYSDVTVFSFHPVKIITTGEGGMILTDEEDLYHHLKELRDHGMSRNRKYLHIALGFNYRMTNMQAAVGLAQLERFDEILDLRKKQELLYEELLFSPELSFRPKQDWAETVHWMMTIKINKDGIRDKLVEYLLKRGIDSRQMIFPISYAWHFQKENNGTTFPVSESISLNSLHLPSSTQLSIKQIEDISQAVLKGLKHCG